MPVTPILGIVTCLMLMFSLPGENWLRLFIWLVIGFVIYFCYGIRHSVMAKQLAARDRHPRSRPRRVDRDRAVSFGDASIAARRQVQMTCPQGLQRPLHVLGQGRGQVQLLAGQGMAEPQPVGVERLAVDQRDIGLLRRQRASADRGRRRPPG